MMQLKHFIIMIIAYQFDIKFPLRKILVIAELFKIRLFWPVFC